MARVNLLDLNEGDRFEDIVLIQSRELRESKQGKPYIHLRVSDKSGSLVGFIWDAGEDLFETVRRSDFARVNARVKSWKDQLQMTIHSIEAVDGSSIDYADFLPKTPFDIDAMFETVREAVTGVSNPHLKTLAERFLGDSSLMEDFRTAPAAASLHHACVGGLLEHVASLVRLIEAVAPLYPQANPDLLIMAAFLHDLGKTRELGWGTSFHYTDAGRLLGHISIGFGMLEEKIREIPDFPEDLALELKHILLSHHSKLEFGSPVLPQTIEAVAFGYLDDLDAKMDQTSKALRDTNERWTTRIPSLDGRMLFQGFSESGT
jgi:3'-5' exoribonuclease